jgi:hypothetical protein
VGKPGPPPPRRGGPLPGPIRGPQTPGPKVPTTGTVRGSHAKGARIGKK